MINTTSDGDQQKSPNKIKKCVTIAHNNIKVPFLEAVGMLHYDKNTNKTTVYTLTKVKEED